MKNALLTLLIVGFCIVLAVTFSQLFRQPLTGAPAHHLAKNRFQNVPVIESHTNLSSLFKWLLSRKTPSTQQFPIVAIDPDVLSDVHKKSSVTWLGHSTFLLKHAGLTVLTDPHLSERASPVSFAGPKRYMPAPVTVAQLPHIDVVIISHDHYDHLDLPTIKQLYKKQNSKPPLFIVPLGIGDWLVKQGVESFVQLDWWQHTNVGDVIFSAVPIQHFSGRGLIRNNTLWAGWVIKSLDKKARNRTHTIFFAGDTGYSEHFTQIYDKFGAIDLALIPIGAYAPRWFMKDIHVDPIEAVKIHQDLHAKKSIAMHWGTFILTDEPVDEPIQLLQQTLEAKGIKKDKFIALKHGETHWDILE